MTDGDAPATVDPQRRRLLAASTAALGVAGLAAVGAPFLASWLPSARARGIGAAVELDVGRLEPGALLTVEWRGKPIWILHRTPTMLAALDRATPFLLDPASDDSIQPEYARNAVRARRPEFLVAFGVCTHLGCVPQPKLAPSDPALGDDWPGGFFCACHGSKFDLAGRVFAGVPAPTNLVIPPHRYIDGTRLVIGDPPT